MDITGSITAASNKGNRYILTLVDMATRFPEAVPLKTIDTVQLCLRCSRVMGCQILSNRGLNFTFTFQVMSKVMEDGSPAGCQGLIHYSLSPPMRRAKRTEKASLTFTYPEQPSFFPF